MKATINKTEFEISKVIFKEGFQNSLEQNDLGAPSLSEKDFSFIIIIKADASPRFAAAERFLKEWRNGNPKDISIKNNGIRLNAKECVITKKPLTVLGLCEFGVTAKHAQLTIKNKKSIRTTYVD